MWRKTGPTSVYDIGLEPSTNRTVRYEQEARRKQRHGIRKNCTNHRLKSAMVLKLGIGELHMNRIITIAYGGCRLSPSRAAVR